MTWPTTLGWWRQAEQQVARTLTVLADQDRDAPSLLPGWTRRIVVAHLDRNGRDGAEHRACRRVSEDGRSWGLD